MPSNFDSATILFYDKKVQNLLLLLYGQPSGELNNESIKYRTSNKHSFTWNTSETNVVREDSVCSRRHVRK